MTESTSTQMDQEVKSEPPDNNDSSPDFIPLHKSPKPNTESKSPFKSAGNENNSHKRIKTESNDESSKKPRISIPEASTEIVKGDYSVNISDSEEYYLLVSNLPINWSYVQIKNYLDKECGHVDEMEMLERENSQHSAIRLTFQTPEKCIDVYKKLQDKVIEDKKIELKISDTYTTCPSGVTISTSAIKQNDDVTKSEVTPNRHWRPDLDSWDSDPEGLYGLRPQFLKSLNITPPLNKMVHVTNFRCDKNELKEVMQMAGDVLMCCVVTTIQRYAKVMYSHPLEAVQAISMLNGQMYYGIPLKITMDKSPADSIVLPKGLANIGVGLGSQGRPIRNIVNEYQRYVKNQSSLINPIVFSEIRFGDKTDDNSEDIQKEIDDFLKSPPGCNILNAAALRTQSIEELESQDANSKEGSNRSTPETQISKIGVVGSSKASVGSLSPIDSLSKNGSAKQNINSPALATPALGAAPPNPLGRLGTHSGQGFIHPNLLLNPPVPMHNPLPGPGEPFYRPGNPHVQEPPRQFRPRAVPFMPMQRAPPFQPQPMPPPFGPAAGIRAQVPPQVPPANFNGPRPTQGNRVTVKFSNLPPSTTFPLLCEQLAQCGQVMSVQLTTPGCAVATFGHPSHADRCIQTFNGMNVEGFIIEVRFF